MTKILILTKNSLAEQDLQSALQRLNDEVYCSSSLLYQAADCLELIQHFSVIILSDTISTLELVDCLPILLKSGRKIVRKGDRELIKSGEYSWMLEDIDDWIDAETPTAELVEVIARNNVSEKKESQQENQISLNKMNAKGLSEIKCQHFISGLSSNERKVLLQLYKAESKTVAREDFCQSLWESAPTNSNLSQLSSLINRIKIKIEEVGFEKSELQTVWGKGYRMGLTIHSFLAKNEFGVRS
ncbi:winged helix-turn-helix domain-containing protein [Candidatus Enterococcus murrayae]|uniref:Winged helix-turn-helix domain-containing protein n=1 Tax=Candidatus Enterococcus murrayae TaxID=2815321 RepID=A0ABS3HEF9_9ENTE|nr:winged helix-turn-helix domain-containing protein [Enterococcus sp. MJM16]MBO0451836.1 winged helix-turn-helix domain-containing protein [Enterococcus sp. MJM16]